MLNKRSLALWHNVMKKGKKRRNILDHMAGLAGELLEISRNACADEPPNTAEGHFLGVALEMSQKIESLRNQLS